MNAGCELLLTGFEPFADHAINPSGMAALAMAKRLGSRVMGAVLPVDYAPARRMLEELLAQRRPAACLCMGVSPAAVFQLELRARKPEQFAELHGPLEARAALPPRAVEYVEETGCFGLSEDAGQYVCESTLWALLRFREENGWPGAAGFLHVPRLTEEWTQERINEQVEAFLKSWIA